MWKATSGSTGAVSSPQSRAKTSDENSEKRGPYSAVYSATSPAVIVRGVAWTITWPRRKSSK
jgi:hypothetical protein